MIQLHLKDKDFVPIDMFICSLKSITLEEKFVGPGNSIGYLGLAPFDKTKLTIYD
jgi:hypothetical protein